MWTPERADWDAHSEPPALAPETLCPSCECVLETEPHQLTCPASTLALDASAALAGELAVQGRQLAEHLRAGTPHALDLADIHIRWVCHLGRVAVDLREAWMAGQA